MTEHISLKYIVINAIKKPIQIHLFVVNAFKKCKNVFEIAYLLLFLYFSFE